MDRDVLARFRLPGPLRDHAAIATNDHDDDCRCAPCLVNSVMPKVVARCNAFRDSLRPRERGAFDLEDVLQEIWLELLIKAEKFRPDRAKYITFALMLVNRKLGDIRNRWHLVPGPKDTASRLRRAEGCAGRTDEKVRQTVRETGSLAAEPAELLDDDATADEQAQAVELRSAHRGALMAALRRLGSISPTHAFVLRLLYGIDADEPLEVGQVADRLHMTVARVLAIKHDAEKELRRRIEDLRDARRLDLVGFA